MELIDDYKFLRFKVSLGVFWLLFLVKMYVNADWENGKEFK